ncbi:MAG: TonB-dependent receptor [Acidobacteria bacterium]|nr:TonB-dependent receptor [Acidobacteriota bacterium]
MTLGRFAWLTVLAILASPPLASAQEATLVGIVRDNTAAVLPGVTVTATHEAAGNTFVGVTDQNGVYRISLRTGVYRVSAELTGFTTVVRPGIELLLGREVTLNMDMAVSGVQETVTVTGEAPLIEVTTSTVSGNIDPRQMSELPVNGRNWMDLSLLAPGSRSNSASEVPQDRQGFFQVSLDGQQITQLICCSQQQPRYSRDAIAEFELITNRFDATQGRSQGMLVNAITKSGTNTPAGTFSGYFRDDDFNAEDFIQRRVLPYSDQQLSATFGGPIRRDRIHFFGNYEYEREPQTVTFNSPYPSFNIDLPGTRTQHTGGVRGDAQFTPQSHLTVRYSKYYQLIPRGGTGGAALHPSTSRTTRRESDQIWLTQAWVLNDRSLNQLKGGFSKFQWAIFTDPKWQGGAFPVDKGMGGTAPTILFTGYSIGTQPSNAPQDIFERIWSIRDDFTLSYTAAGRHDLKTGAEYLHWYGDWIHWCNRCAGVLVTNSRPPANVESLFPVWNDVSTWNLAPLSPLVIRYEESFGDHSMTRRRDVFAFWLQDDWAATSRLTLNLGVRYDLDLGVLGEDIEFRPWLSGNRPHDANNIAPRLGFAFQMNDRTVIRGGYGLFYTQLESDAAHQSELWSRTTIPQILNDGRPDFAVNPFNGPKPTYEQVLANACDQTNNRPGCFRRSITIEIPGPSEPGMEKLHEVSFSHQASIGVQRQIGTAMAVEANYVFTGGRHEEVARNMNLSYNAATLANNPFTNRALLPFPDWGTVLGEFMIGRTNYHGLEMNFTKRMSNRWQANATYSLSGFYDSPGEPVFIQPEGRGGIRWSPLAFRVQPDLGDDYALAVTDQRHRATFNGIWEVGYGVQLSGLYFFGSGLRYVTNWGGDLRNLGTTADQGNWGAGRLRPDGTIVPRNSLAGDPIHRVDVRIQKRFRIAGRVTADGMAEVFNVFNHANYGSYVTAQSNARFGQPSFNANVAYQPRIVQLGFRFAF